MPSLIMENVFTKIGPQTFTLRWKESDIMDWGKIYDFLYKKSGLHPKYHKVKVNRDYIKYTKINDIDPFDLKEFAYYYGNGKSTQVGLLKVRVDENTIRKNSDNLVCINLW